MTAMSTVRTHDDRVALFRPAFEHAKASPALWWRFASLGLPSRAQESWHYADVSALGRVAWAVATGAADAARVAALRADLALDEAAHPIVLVNGYLVGGAPSGNRGAGQAASAPAHSLMTLNEALAPHPLTLNVEAGQPASLSVASLSVPAGDGEMAHPRIVIELAAGASADIRLEYAGVDGARYWTNPVVEIALGDGARARVMSLVREGAAALHTGVITATIGREARFALTELVLGGRSTRREVMVNFLGEGGEAELAGAYLGGDEAKIDIRSEVIHAAPRCRSRQMYRGVLDDKAFAAFQGRVYVAPHAQGTDAAQTTRSLLLKRTAEAAAKPELEIHADDVKCSHGATVGELDPDMLFYLKARGVPAAAARAMLVEAFIAEVLESITETSLRERNINRVGQWMLGRGERA